MSETAMARAPASFMSFFRIGLVQTVGFVVYLILPVYVQALSNRGYEMVPKPKILLQLRLKLLGCKQQVTTHLLEEHLLLNLKLETLVNLMMDLKKENKQVNKNH